MTSSIGAFLVQNMTKGHLHVGCALESVMQVSHEFSVRSRVPGIGTLKVFSFEVCGSVSTFLLLKDRK